MHHFSINLVAPKHLSRPQHARQPGGRPATVPNRSTWCDRLRFFLPRYRQRCPSDCARRSSSNAAIPTRAHGLHRDPSFVEPREAPMPLRKRPSIGAIPMTVSRTCDRSKRKPLVVRPRCPSPWAAAGVGPAVNLGQGSPYEDGAGDCSRVKGPIPGVHRRRWPRQSSTPPVDIVISLATARGRFAESPPAAKAFRRRLTGPSEPRCWWRSGPEPRASAGPPAAGVLGPRQPPARGILNPRFYDFPSSHGGGKWPAPNTKQTSGRRARALPGWPNVPLLPPFDTSNACGAPGDTAHQDVES